MAWFKLIPFLIPAIRDLLKDNKASTCLIIALGVVGFYARADLLQRDAVITQNINEHTKAIHKIQIQNAKVITKLESIGAIIMITQKTVGKVNDRVWEIYKKLPK